MTAPHPAVTEQARTTGAVPTRTTAAAARTRAGVTHATPTLSATTDAAARAATTATTVATRGTHPDHGTRVPRSPGPATRARGATTRPPAPARPTVPVLPTVPVRHMARGSATTEAQGDATKDRHPRVHRDRTTGGPRAATRDEREAAQAATATAGTGSRATVTNRAEHSATARGAVATGTGAMPAHRSGAATGLRGTATAPKGAAGKHATSVRQGHVPTVAAALAATIEGAMIARTSPARTSEDLAARVATTAARRPTPADVTATTLGPLSVTARGTSSRGAPAHLAQVSGRTAT